MSDTTGTKYKRRLRNYLLDAGLQLRYTAAIALVAAFVTAGLGYKMYDATRDTSKVVSMSMGILDPATTAIMQEQFASSDRTVLFGIVGFGVVLVLSIGAAGILITHKVAGPIYQISLIVNRIRDGHLAPPMRKLRKGDELVEFHAAVKAMHDALRARAEEDVRVLGDAIAALEHAGSAAGVLEEARTLRRKKEESLGPPADPPSSGPGV